MSKSKPCKSNPGTVTVHAVYGDAVCSSSAYQQVAKVARKHWSHRAFTVTHKYTNTRIHANTSPWVGSTTVLLKLQWLGKTTERAARQGKDNRVAWPLTPEGAWTNRGRQLLRWRNMSTIWKWQGHNRITNASVHIITATLVQEKEHPQTAGSAVQTPAPPVYVSKYPWGRCSASSGVFLSCKSPSKRM